MTDEICTKCRDRYTEMFLKGGFFATDAMLEGRACRGHLFPSNLISTTMNTGFVWGLKPFFIEFICNGKSLLRIPPERR